MSVRRGEEWGEHGELPHGAIVVDSDGALGALVRAARLEGAALPTVGLVGGDLCRTLGGRGDEASLRAEGGVVAEVDVGCVMVDGRRQWFVAHLAAHRRGWAGEVYVAMNAEFLGRWDLGPRAHPGDGRLDVTEGRLGLRDRLAARRRAVHGDHLPHPALRTRQITHELVELPAPTPVHLDGLAVGLARQLAIRVEPAALRVVVPTRQVNPSR